MVCVETQENLQLVELKTSIMNEFSPIAGSSNVLPRSIHVLMNLASAPYVCYYGRCIDLNPFYLLPLGPGGLL